jgi:hypothetical protein
MGLIQNAPGRTPHERTEKPNAMTYDRLHLYQKPAARVGVHDALQDLNQTEPLTNAPCGDL